MFPTQHPQTKGYTNSNVNSKCLSFWGSEETIHAVINTKGSNSNIGLKVTHFGCTNLGENHKTQQPHNFFWASSFIKIQDLLERNGCS